MPYIQFSEVLPFNTTSVAFLDSKRILNPHEPPREWRTSSRISKTSSRSSKTLLYPDRVEQAIYSMRHEIHACGVIFDDEPVASLFPFGPVWINTSDGIESWGVSWAREMYRGQSFRGAFGHICQDGCKFSSGTSSNRPANLQGIIVKKLWIPRIIQDLQALVQKNEPWHNGTGVYT